MMNPPWTKAMAKRPSACPATTWPLETGADMTRPTTPNRRAWISVAAPVSELRKTKSSSCWEAPRSNFPIPWNSCTRCRRRLR